MDYGNSKQLARIAKGGRFSKGASERTPDACIVAIQYSNNALAVSIK
jgi:hypothetical protein